MVLESEDVVSGVNWRSDVVSRLNRPGWRLEDLTPWFTLWFYGVCHKAGFTADERGVNAHTTVRGDIMDAVPRNMMVTDDGAIEWIDQEWVWPEPIELGFMIFRAVFSEFPGIPSVAVPSTGTPLDYTTICLHLARKVGIVIHAQDLVRYVAQENDFQEQVAGYACGEKAELRLQRQLNARR